MSVAKLNKIASDLQCGGVTLDRAVAQQIEKSLGKRFSKQEEAALLAMADGVQKGTIKTDGLVGQHYFVDLLTHKTEGRLAHAMDEANTWGARAGAVATAVAGAGGAVAGALTGAAFGVAAQGAGVGALAGFASGRLLGTVIGFIKGLIED